MTTSRAARVLVAVAAALLLAGCGSTNVSGTGSAGATSGSATTEAAGSTGTSDTAESSSRSASCDATGCTITFPRKGDGTVSVFGVEARLVSVDGGSARIAVANQTIVVPVGSTTQVQGFTVGVERVTDDAVVVRVTR